MDLDVSMRLSNYPYAIQFYGALFKEVRFYAMQFNGALVKEVWNFMVLQVLFIQSLALQKKTNIRLFGRFDQSAENNLAISKQKIAVVARTCDHIKTEISTFYYPKCYRSLLTTSNVIGVCLLPQMLWMFAYYPKCYRQLLTSNVIGVCLQPQKLQAFVYCPKCYRRFLTASNVIGV